MVRKTEENPLWTAEKTRHTVEDEPEEEAEESSTGSLWARFLGFGAAVAVGGWAIARSAEGIVSHTGLQEGFVGGVLMGGTNAIPETITSVAAVRRGALTLAIGGVLGGNTFDALNVMVGDVFYRGGSLYHAAAEDDLFLTAATVLMTAVLLAGLLRRERHGPANIGLEGWLILGSYGTAVVVLGF